MHLLIFLLVAVAPNFLTSADDETCSIVHGEIWEDWVYLYTDTLAQFDDARDCCSYRSGAELVSIHSAEENEFASHFLHDFMIGLYYKGNNQFVWTDGTPVDYLSLADDFAYNRSDYNCFKNLDGKWMNYPCKDEKHYVMCKGKVSENPVTANNTCPDSTLIYNNAGELYSPGYPSFYDARANLRCQYHLQAPEGWNVAFHMRKAYIDSDDCFALRVYEGWDATEDKLLYALFDSVELVPPIWTKSSNRMLVLFNACGYGEWAVDWYSDKSVPVQPTGLPGTTTVHQNSEVCPKDNTLTNVDYKEIYSPGFPFAYEANIECDYNVYVKPQVPEEGTVKIYYVRFMDLIIGNDDWIELLDARTDTVFASTRQNTGEGDEVEVDFDFIIRFHSGSNPGLFDRWILEIFSQEMDSDK